MVQEYTIIGVIQNHKTSVCNVELDSGEKFNFSFDLILKYKIKKGKKITKQALQEIVSEQRIITAKQTAMAFISYKPRTESQVAKKLKQEKFTSEEINTAIQFLKEFGYLDDEHYARKYVEYAKTHKKSSRRKIEADLLKRGIDKEIILNAIGETLSNDEEFENAIKIAMKKYALLQSRNIEKPEQKVINYLLSKGFSFEIVKTITAKFSQELRDFAHPEGLEPPAL